MLLAFARITAVWSVSVLGAFVFTWLVGPGQYYGLAHHGVKTAGTVVALESENHWFVRYQYAVGGTSYTGVGSAGRGGTPGFNALAVGHTVTVTFEPSRPSSSCLGDAAIHYSEEIHSSFWGAVWLATFISTVVLLRLALKARSSQGDAPIGEPPPNKRVHRSARS